MSNHFESHLKLFMGMGEIVSLEQNVAFSQLHSWVRGELNCSGTCWEEGSRGIEKDNLSLNYIALQSKPQRAVMGQVIFFT